MNNVAGSYRDFSLVSAKYVRLSICLIELLSLY
jgi:hypothetical protein